MMLGLYLLLNVLIHPGVQDAIQALNISNIASFNRQPEVTLSFVHLNGIKLGTAVLSEGHLIGRVARIEIISEENAGETKPSRYQVKVELVAGAPTGDVSPQMVALQTMPVTAVRTTPETVIELFTAPPAERGCASNEAICGYSSYEEFWSAATPQRAARGAHKKSV